MYIKKWQWILLNKAFYQNNSPWINIDIPNTQPCVLLNCTDTGANLKSNCSTKEKKMNKRKFIIEKI